MANNINQNPKIVKQKVNKQMVNVNNWWISRGRLRASGDVVADRGGRPPKSLSRRKFCAGEAGED